MNDQSDRQQENGGHVRHHLPAIENENWREDYKERCQGGRIEIEVEKSRARIQQAITASGAWATTAYLKIR